MSRFSELHVQDKANNLLCYIDPDDCNECYTDREVNGSNTMTISIDVNSCSAQYLKKDNRVMFYDYDKAKWYEYIVSETSVNNEELQVDLESSLYITLSNVIEFVDVTGRTVINGMQEAFDAAVPKPQWSPGASDINGSFYMQRTRVTLKEWIFDWTEKVSGELEEEITILNGIVVRKVNIKSSIGKDLGKTLYDDRDITDIDVTDPTRTVYTAAFGYGKSESIDDTGESKPITFEDVEWKVENGDPVDKPIGQKWVELPEEYKQKYGYYDTDKVLQNSFYIYKEDNIEVKEELLERTYQFLIDNVEDKTEYRISAIDFYSLAGEGIEINLGDIIGIVVKQLDYKMYRVKVKRYKEDLVNKSNNDFELNNSATDIIDVINDSENNYSEIKDKVDGLVNKGLTESVLDGWNEEINKDSGYLIYASPQDGLVAYNAKTPELSTKATQIKGGSVRVANTKTSGAFNWTTVMTGDGLVATALYTGTIKGDMFDFDLDTGVIKMGTRNVSGIIDDPYFYLNKSELSISATKFTLQGRTISDISKEQVIDSLNEYDKTINQEEIFNRLTNNGVTQGIYLENEKIYINAQYMQIGKISDKAGISYWDLSTGEMVIGGTIEQRTDGNLTIRIRNNVMDFYAPEDGGNFIGWIGGLVIQKGSPQVLCIGHDVGDRLVLARKDQSSGGYIGQLELDDSYVWLKSDVKNKFGTANKIFIGSDYIYTMKLAGNPNWYIHCDTNIGAFGISIWSSDGRMKENIKETETEALQVINQIQHRQFDWKDHEKHENIGFIAQELEKINQDFVTKVPQYDEDGKTVIDERYQISEKHLIPYITKSIQELHEKVKELQYQTSGIKMYKVSKQNEQIQQYDDEITYYIPEEKEDEILYK